MVKHKRLWAGLAGAATAAIGVTVWAFHSPSADPSESKAATAPRQSKDTDTGALLQSGLQSQAQQDLAGAAKSYRRVLEIDPRNKDAWYRLGLIAQQNGRTAEARADFDKALKTDPSFVSALYSEANMVTASEPDQAIELLKRAVATAPKSAVMQLQLGTLLAKQHRDAEAKKAFRQAVAADHRMLAQVPEAFRDSVRGAATSGEQ
ncbi:tetratricopeptide repeat protein [Streptomyces sp. NPDC007206]|uniref:tetratricopeptide repeat protein n=1 Tax=Streptomyces sp. NPDC007206 TaxID=3154317 RepID=UPI0033EEE411